MFCHKWTSCINVKTLKLFYYCNKVTINNILYSLQGDGDSVVTEVEEDVRGASGAAGGKVLTSISTSSSSGPTSGSSSSSSASSSGTATGGGDTYGEETSPYDSYDGYTNYDTYYDEATAAPDGDTTRRVTITSTDIGTGGELDLGVGGKIDLAAGTGIERSVITSGEGTSVTISNNKTSVG